MVRGTTPDYVLVVDADLREKTVYVTIKQGNTELTLTGTDLDVVGNEESSVISIRLTQEQTLNLVEGRAEVQVKFIGSDGDTQGTEIRYLTVSRALLERVISYA